MGEPNIVQRIDRKIARIGGDRCVEERSLCATGEDIQARRSRHHYPDWAELHQSTETAVVVEDPDIAGTIYGNVLRFRKESGSSRCIRVLDAKGPVDGL